MYFSKDQIDKLLQNRRVPLIEIERFIRENIRYIIPK